MVDGQAFLKLVAEADTEMPLSMFDRLFEDSSLDNVLDLPVIDYAYESIDWPEHLLTEELVRADNRPVDNPVTNAGAQLGRVLSMIKSFRLISVSPAFPVTNRRVVLVIPTPSAQGLMGG